MTGRVPPERYAALLNLQPISAEDERRKGAVRVVRCVRSNDGDVKQPARSFIWSVLVLDAPGSKNAEATPHATGVIGRGMFAHHVKVDAIFLDGAHVLTNGCEWTVREFQFDVPAAVTRLTVACGRNKATVDAAMCSAMMGEYYRRIRNAAAAEDEYGAWLECHRRDVLSKLPVPNGPDRPLMSIVCPLYQTPPEFFVEMVRSILAQTYDRWELILVNASPDDVALRNAIALFDDERIVVVECPENLGIVGNTNIGIEHCTGDFVSFLDHDDYVEPQALAAIVDAIQRSPKPVDLAYCDEDSIGDDGRFWNPLFKPGPNQDLLYSNMYILHWLTVSRYALDHTERSSSDVEGAQDYDLALKTLSLGRGVVHVPYVLYHWRIHAGSENLNPDAKGYAQENGRRAIEDRLRRDGLAASVERGPTPFTYRVAFAMKEPAPSILILSLGGAPDVAMDSALQEYANTFAVATGIEAATIRPSAGHLAETIAACRCDLLLVAECDMQLAFGDLTRLAGYFSRGNICAVSPRVGRTDGLVEYAGSIVSPDGQPVGLGRLLPLCDEGYIGRLHRSYSAAVVNPACCLCSVSVLRALGIDDRFETFGHALRDVFLRAYGQGYQNVYVPYATARLSSPRSMLVDGARVDDPDARLFVEKHPGIIAGDPSHNRNFDPYSPYYLLR